MNTAKSIWTVTTLCLCATTAQASTLIQCPDWRSLVPQPTLVTLAKHAPKVSFDTKLASNALTTGQARRGFLPSKTNNKTTTTLSCPTYKVKPGDTLAKISRTFLGSSKRYPALLAANKTRVTSTGILRVGTILTIPCTLGTAKTNKPGRKAGGAQVIAADTRAALANSGRQSLENSVITAKPKSALKTAGLPPIAPAKPLPVWKAKSGEYLSDVIKRWGKAAGYKVILTGAAAWRLQVPIKEVGTFEDSLKRLIKGFGAQGYPPSVRVFSNKVIKIGSVL